MQYFMLEAGDVIQDGDQVRYGSGSEYNWEICHRTLGIKISHDDAVIYHFRRPITKELLRKLLYEEEKQIEQITSRKITIYEKV